MDWLTALALSFYLLAVVLAVRRWSDYGWDERLASCLFLLGVGIEMFVDEVAVLLGATEALPEQSSWAGLAVLLLAALTWLGRPVQSVSDTSPDFE